MDESIEGQRDEQPENQIRGLQILNADYATSLGKEEEAISRVLKLHNVTRVTDYKLHSKRFMYMNRNIVIKNVFNNTFACIKVNNGRGNV